jgi:integrase
MALKHSNRFTDSKIKGLMKCPPGKGKPPKVFFEGGGQGFGVRIHPTCKVTFFYEYRFNERKRNLTIGSYPKVTLRRAREEVVKALVKIEDGIDPGLERKIGKLADRNAVSVKDLAVEYIQKHAMPNKKSWKKDQEMLNRDVIPIIGTRKVKDIRKRDIVFLLDRIVGRGTSKQPCGSMANRVRALLITMFKFAVQRDILDASPCVYLNVPHKEKARERDLAEKEIKIFWEGLNNTGMVDSVKLALKFILVTGQRPGEVASAEWSEVDTEKKCWEIPSGKTKNGRLHSVPLSTLALELLREAKKNADDSRWLFPSPYRKLEDSPIAAGSLPHAVQSNLSKLMIDHFTPHDLRRTAATQMPAAGVDRRLTISKILNHSEKGVTGEVYDKYSYYKEKRQVLEAWGRKLESIIAGEKTAKIVELIRK